MKMPFISFYYCSGKNASERIICIIPKDQFKLSGPRLRDLEGFLITELPIERQDMTVHESRLMEISEKYKGQLKHFSQFKDPDIKKIYGEK